MADQFFQALAVDGFDQNVVKADSEKAQAIFREGVCGVGKYVHLALCLALAQRYAGFFTGKAGHADVE